MWVGLFSDLKVNVAKAIKEIGMSKVSSWKTICFLCVVCAATAITSPAQNGCSVSAPCFTNLVSFDGTDNANPEYGPPLVQGRDGNFYGTTTGGSTANGTVFEITAAGTLTTVHTFISSDGYFPYAGLALGTDGELYGTASAAGLYNFGTVFKTTETNITDGSVLTVLHNFQNSTDGAFPMSALMQAADRNFYGTTPANASGPNHNGTVFKVTSTGNLTTLYTFQNGTDGTNPVAALIQGANGNFYGMTDSEPGTIFQITPTGKLSTLHTFNGTDGLSPNGTLVQAANGNFYGTTVQGGANCSNIGCGTVFKMTAGGTLTTLYSFCSQPGCTDGNGPIGGMVQATDGNFYGTTSAGGIIGSCGNPGCGTLFRITPTGVLTTLHTFSSSDGATPQAGLMQATNGNLYGTTTLGGASNNGTVFSLSVGLGPFVEALTYSGKVGNTIEFLGQGFTSSTTVFFNGTAASRTVVSGTYLTATIPSGATTGFVTVTTSGGTLKSNKKFRIIPQITSFSPTSGPVGTVVTIKGVSLTQTTTVTFGGVKATSKTVVNDTTITATVPSGAKTGKIGVTTLGGTATSAGTFTVT
jgi:uncharacterized repeat protein (TIGR03803 family)